MLNAVFTCSNFLFVHRRWNYENINKNDYYTISKKAVTHVYNNDIEFIEID